jgi:hypothetical protein
MRLTSQSRRLWKRKCLHFRAPHSSNKYLLTLGSETDVFLANGVATFFSQLGGTIAIPIGNAILLNALGKNIPIYAEGLDPHTIVNEGPLAITHLTKNPDMVLGIRLAYTKAIQHIMIFSLACVCASVPAAAGMQWLNIRKVAEARTQVKAAQAAAVAAQQKSETTALTL